MRGMTFGLTLALLSGCAPKMMMLDQTMMPGQTKSIRSSIRTVGSTKDETLNNFYLAVCDVEAGQSTNCKTTLVLENIVDYDVNTGWGAR